VIQTATTGNEALLLSLRDAATRLGLKEVTVRTWARRRKIASVRLGRRLLIPAAEIARLIEDFTTPRLREWERQ
jgi:excisionase family DNA binding protein